MKYREIGKTGKKISTISFGCMRLPVLDGDNTKIDEEHATKMIHYAYEKGVNYYDTAYPYHGNGFNNHGQSEYFLGNALKEIRDKVYIASKLPSWLVKSREDMDKFLDEQLEALQTDYIDFYLLHTLSEHNYEELKKHDVFDFLEKAKSSGKIKHIGFPFHDVYPAFEEIINDYDWEFCQVQYNILDQDYQAGTKGIRLANKKGIGVIVMEPLRGGRILEIKEKAVQVLAECNPDRSLVDWALSWIFNDEGVSTVLSGMSTLEQTIENMKIAEKSAANDMSSSELLALDRVIKSMNESIQIPCTSCGYCSPCPEGVDIPMCFSHYNNYYFFEDNKRAQKSAAFQYDFRTPEENQAAACVGCLKCEEHCPQNIKISEELKKVDELFKG